MDNLVKDLRGYWMVKNEKHCDQLHIFNQNLKRIYGYFYQNILCKFFTLKFYLLKSTFWVE